MKGGIITALSGMVVMLVGLIFAGIFNTQAATSGAAANIGSFSGVRSFNDLLPLIFMVGLMVIGLGLMLGGGYSTYKNLKKT
jgi:hypothetical protein